MTHVALSRDLETIGAFAGTKDLVAVRRGAADRSIELRTQSPIISRGLGDVRMFHHSVGICRERRVVPIREELDGPVEGILGFDTCTEQNSAYYAALCSCGCGNQIEIVAT